MEPKLINPPEMWSEYNTLFYRLGAFVLVKRCRDMFHNDDYLRYPQYYQHLTGKEVRPATATEIWQLGMQYPELLEKWSLFCYRKNKTFTLYKHEGKVKGKVYEGSWLCMSIRAVGVFIRVEN